MYSRGHTDGSSGGMVRERSKDMSLAKFSTIFRQGLKKDAQRFWLFTVHGIVYVHRYEFSATLYTCPHIYTQTRARAREHTHTHHSVSLSLSLLCLCTLYIHFTLALHVPSLIHFPIPDV